MHKSKEHARICSLGWITTRSVHTVRAELGTVLGWGSMGTVCGPSTETMNKEMLGSVETSRRVIFKLVPQGSQEGVLGLPRIGNAQGARAHTSL